MTTDIPSAARRVAVYIRARSKFSEGANSLLPDFVALLSVLDAVGAEPGEDRVERTTAGIVAEMRRQADASGAFGLGYFDPDDVTEAVVDGRVDLTALARAAIALADAEKAAATAEGWAAYEEARGEYMNAADLPFNERHVKRLALDAAVLRLAGMPKPGAPIFDAGGPGSEEGSGL